MIWQRSLRETFGNFSVPAVPQLVSFFRVFSFVRSSLQRVCTVESIELMHASAPGGLAQELLNTEDAELEITTRKIKKLFAKDIDRAARDGTIGRELYAVCMPLRMRLKALRDHFSFARR